MAALALCVPILSGESVDEGGTNPSNSENSSLKCLLDSVPLWKKQTNKKHMLLDLNSAILLLILTVKTTSSVALAATQMS